MLVCLAGSAQTGERPRLRLVGFMSRWRAFPGAAGEIERFAHLALRLNAGFGMVGSRYGVDVSIRPGSGSDGSCLGSSGVRLLKRTFSLHTPIHPLLNA